MKALTLIALAAMAVESSNDRLYPCSDFTSIPPIERAIEQDVILTVADLEAPAVRYEVTGGARIHLLVQADELPGVLCVSNVGFIESVAQQVTGDFSAHVPPRTTIAIHATPSGTWKLLEPADSIFADGFECGSIVWWNHSSGAAPSTTRPRHCPPASP